MSELIKTIKLKLNVSKEQETQFLEMTKQYQNACNFVSKYVFDNGFCLERKKLHRALYHEIRNVFYLKSMLAESVLKTVLSKYDTVKEQMKQNPMRCKETAWKWCTIPRTLEWLWKPIQFKVPQADLVYNRDYSFLKDKTILSLNTLDKRTKCTFETKHYDEYFDGTWKFGTAKLVRKRNKWYLHIPMTKSVKDIEEKPKHIVGIDRGMRFLMATYDEEGKTVFYSGKKVSQKRKNFQKVRTELQSKGTKSAKRRLKKISGRENRWMTDVNHCLSKTLVEKYGEDTLYVLEDLTGVSFEESNLSKNKEKNHDLRSWSFYQLEQFLSYKALERKSKVLKVSAKYTSQRCPKCGKIRRENRDQPNHFYSCSCGFRSNDDRTAAMNIYELGKKWVNGEKNPCYSRKTA